MLAPLGACDLQPPPKGKPAPTTVNDQAGSAAVAPPPSAPPAAPSEPTPMPPTLPPDAGTPPAPDAMEVSQQCLEVSTHIATVLIKDAKDPAAKAALEQDKAKIIRRAAEGCTRDQWPATAFACFLKGETVAALEICGKDLRAP